ncbi:MAG: thiamine ABC transporter substrate binding subunit [Rubrimonas sp.]|uniref:thiamine ABC transporter substrate binding subunit n=1 Tax=Rubrimonas sp. TaxID=2036015 RepID=UPI002FDD5825
MKPTPLSAATVAFALLGLAAPAQERPVLTVYAYDSFVSEYGPGPVIEARFEAQCGCDLNLVAAGDGAALLGRLRLEGERSPADVVLGLDLNLIAAAKDAGLTAPHGIDAPPLDLPVDWSDPHFLPFDWGWFAFVYDETRLTDAPDSFEALIAAPEDVTIVIQDPRTSTPGLGLLLWIKETYGDRAPEIWEALAPRIVTVTRGWWEAYSAFLDGEAMMALSYTSSPAYHAIAEDDPTKRAALFSEGHPLQIEVAAALANAPQPELARDFLRFMLSPDFQSAIPTTNWMYPARAEGAELPGAFAALPRPARSILTDPEAATALREEALAEWLDALSR